MLSPTSGGPSVEATRSRFRRGHAAAALLLALSAGLLLFSLRAQEQTADSLDYALSARTGAGMYHPHHLLFIPIVRLFLHGLARMGIGPDPILAGQIHNILWGIVTTVCLFWAGERLLGSPFGGIVAAFFLLVARGFWLYSTQLEVYVPATGCLALMTVLLLTQRRDSLRVVQGLLLSFLLALAVLYHQSSLLFCIPLGYWLIRGRGKARAWKNLWVLLPSGALVLVAYLIAFRYTDVETRIPDVLSVTQRSTLGGFVRFCLAYGFYPQTGWGTFRNVLSVMGIARLVHSQVQCLVTFPWILRFIVIPGFGLLLAGLVLWHARRSVRGAAEAPARRFLLLWLLTYYGFFLWWFPGEREFFITPLYPLILLAALAVKDMSDAGGALAGRRAWVRGAVLGLLGVVAAINAAQTILPRHRDRGSSYAAASTLAGRLPAECLVVGDYSVGQNLRYYFGRERFWEAAMPLFYFYRGLPLPERYRPERQECLAVDLSFVSPDYSLGGLDAYGHPAAWTRFLTWLLGVEEGARPGAPASCRRFEAMGDIEESAYLRLHSERQAMDGLRDIFRRLDDAIEKSRPGDRPFETFLKTVNPVPPGPSGVQGP
jgi:4-amino-4-deoxy-L-arabinose transferase-like glycosyltransferase